MDAAAILYFVLIVCPSRLPSNSEQQTLDEYVHTYNSVAIMRAARSFARSLSGSLGSICCCYCFAVDYLSKPPSPSPPARSRVVLFDRQRLCSCLCVHLFMFANLRHLHTTHPIRAPCTYKPGHRLDPGGGGGWRSANSRFKCERAIASYCMYANPTPFSLAA